MGTWIIAAILVLAQQPMKLPKGQRIAESVGPQISQQTNSANEEKQPTANLVFFSQTQASIQSEDANQAEENIHIQGKLVIFTGLLVIVGLLQAVILAFTICAIRGQTAAHNASERAWILIESAKIIKKRDGTSLYPVIRNTGKTVARITGISLGGARPLQVSEELPTTPIMEGRQELDFVLSPGGELPLLNVPWVPVHPENMQSVEDGILSMCIYGLIEYRDFTNKERQTGFCLIFDSGKRGIEAGFYPYSKAPRSYNKAT